MSGKNIVLVSENPGIGKKISDILGTDDIDVEITKTPTEALPYLSNGHNLVILDFTNTVYSSTIAEKIARIYRLRTGKKNLPVAAIVKEREDDVGWVSTSKKISSNQAYGGIKVFDASTSCQNQILNYVGQSIN